MPLDDVTLAENHVPQQLEWHAFYTSDHYLFYVHISVSSTDCRPSLPGRYTPSNSNPSERILEGFSAVRLHTHSRATDWSPTELADLVNMVSAVQKLTSIHARCEDSATISDVVHLLQNRFAYHSYSRRLRRTSRIRPGYSVVLECDGPPPVLSGRSRRCTDDVGRIRQEGLSRHR
jgi:hypothetical protein